MGLESNLFELVSTPGAQQIEVIVTLGRKSSFSRLRSLSVYNQVQTLHVPFSHLLRRNALLEGVTSIAFF